MNRNPVTSSQIKSVGYDAATQTLELEFVHGGSVYQYQPFSPDAYQALMSAPSIGSHFLKQIKPRPDLYPFKKVEAAKPGRAPFTKRKKLERSK